MFVDHAEISIVSGKGGDGAVSFRREPFVPNGGPDGGNGGKGGDVVFLADINLRTLMDFKYKRKYKAEDGEPGSKRNRFGKNGEDLIIKVPVGTVIYDTSSGMFMEDLNEDGETFRAAIGGKGGYGNTNFKNSVRQAPNFAEAGGAQYERVVTLELKLIADVGLIGFPNVGKSTLLAASSAARPKIADYHFTTLFPNLGVVSLSNTEFVMADIPGIIEGASEGAGLGFDFLKHIERTKMLVHVLDASGHEGKNPLEDYHKINSELQGYSKNLSLKHQIVALNKIDITDRDSDEFKELTKELDDEGRTYFLISAATREGVKDLLNTCASTLDVIAREETEEDTADINRLEVRRSEEDTDYRDVHIELKNDEYKLTGKQLKKLFDSTNLNDYGSLRYLYKYLVKNGTIDKMKEMGLEEGDTVGIYDFEFEYTDE
jgi:GTP-binding protein